MKKNILVFSVILVLLGCDTTPPSPDTPPPLRFYKSYIQCFRELGEIKHKVLSVWISSGNRIDTVNKLIYPFGNLIEDYSRYYGIDENLSIGVSVRIEQNGLYYRKPMGSKKHTNPDVWKENERINSVYDSLLNLIGDTAFNKSTREHIQVRAIITSISTFVITCNKDYNSKFPKGSDISSLFTVFFDDPYATVKSGYKQAPDHYAYDWFYKYIYPTSIVKTNLATVDFANRPFIGDEWRCMLDVAPDNSDSYTFTVEVTLTDGTVFRATTNPIKIKGKNG
ncbi:MAG: hypothetical protein Q4A56_08890 [Porphyromonadaceae bacterium]|nr:hypothetical protein [Porphyromonadaceae bacterium]